MEQAKNKLSKPWHKYLILTTRSAVVALFLFSMTAALHPKLRKFVRHSVKDQYRTVLSTADVQFSQDGHFKIVKIKTENGLFLEIYDESNELVKPLVDRIHLPDERDGFILFRGQATNLAIDDVNGDKVPEIIAPSFDNNLVAHMNVYSYNPSTKRFEKVSSAF